MIFCSEEDKRATVLDEDSEVVVERKGGCECENSTITTTTPIDK